MPKISLVVPVYNESDTIDSFFAAVKDALREIDGTGYEFEFIAVNDGSSDGTLEKLLRIMEAEPRLRIIDFSRNFGKEAALTAGLDEATGDAVIPIDADGQDPVGLVPQLITKWQEGFEVVLARRVNRARDSFLKRGLARLFYKVHNAISDPAIPNDVGDFRLLDRAVVDALKRFPERRRFMKGLFSWAGFRSASIDYIRPARPSGKSKFSGWKLWNFALEGITSFSTVPLRLWTYLGVGASFMAFAHLAFIFLRTWFFGIELPGYASLLSVILFLGGVQLIGIGVLGEYLGRVYIEVKQRPNYIVRRRYTREP